MDEQVAVCHMVCCSGSRHDHTAPIYQPKINAGSKLYVQRGNKGFSVHIREKMPSLHSNFLQHI
jgi:hypothetical protein